jgi:hypothetical protein
VSVSVWSSPEGLGMFTVAVQVWVRPPEKTLCGIPRGTQ